jgi:hypothetical protein
LALIGGLVLGVFAVAVLPTIAAASCPLICNGTCGDCCVDAGEDCDHGTDNGATCCDTACHWVPTNDHCIPAGGNSCEQGTCNGSHQCEVLDCPFNPCTDTNSCQKCRSTGALTTSFACDNGQASDGTGCQNDSDLCTVEHCAAGVCGGTQTPRCPQPEASCKFSTCNVNGKCVTSSRSNGLPCNDGKPCTYNEQCSNGNCGGAGVTDVTNGTACDDKNDCTTGETCSSGNCTNGTNVSSGTACDDFNNCTNGTTCNASGRCLNGTQASDGASCVPDEPGAGLLGNLCAAGGVCLTGKCTKTCPVNEGTTCTNGDPCNDGFCSGGKCIRRDPTQQSGSVEDYNVCTSSTSCNAAGLAIGTTCVSGTCPVCQNACGTDPNQQSQGSVPVPCTCTYTQ